MKGEAKVGQKFTLINRPEIDKVWCDGDTVVIVRITGGEISFRDLRNNVEGAAGFSFIRDYTEPFLEGIAFVEAWVEKVRAS